MKIVQLDSGERFYETPYGLFPSVTTILQFTMPEKQKQTLNNWRKKKGSQAEVLSKEAAARGTLLHKLIEHKLRGENVECPENLIDFWQKVQSILKVIGKITAIEEEVYHPQLGFAGRLDVLASWRQELTIIDFKTSHREKQKKYLIEGFIQLAAYRGAFEFLYDTKIQQGLIVAISPNNVQVFSLEKEELDKYWQEWLIRLQQYKALNVSPEVF